MIRRRRTAIKRSVKLHCILLEGLNRCHDAPTSPLVQMWIKAQTQNINSTNDPQKSTALERSVKYSTGELKSLLRRAKLTISSDVDQDT